MAETVNVWDRHTWEKGQVNLETQLNKLEADVKKAASLRNAYDYLTQLNKKNPFFYEIGYQTIDYDYMEELVVQAENEKVNTGYCSAVRKGEWFGRNLDWEFDDQVSFVIRVPAINGRLASIGVAQCPGLTAAVVRDRRYSDLYKKLPFLTTDGINEAGLVICSNVVPADDNPKPGITVGPADKIMINNNMVNRWVLDHYKTAWEAVEGMKNDIRICPHPSLVKQGFEAHWMVADRTSTYVVEIYNGEIVYTSYGINRNPTTKAIPAMFNFYNYGVRCDSTNGKLYGPWDSPTHKGTIENNLRPYSIGVERYNLVAEINSDNIYDDYLTADSSEADPTWPWIGTFTGQAETGGLAYSNTYIRRPESWPYDSEWPTEFAGKINDDNIKLTVDHPIGYYQCNKVRQAILAGEGAIMSRNRYAEPKAWTTRHTSVVNIRTKTLNVLSEEGWDDFGGGVYEFTFNNNLTNVPDLRVGGVLKIGDTTLTESQLQDLLALLENSKFSAPSLNTMLAAKRAKAAEKAPAMEETVEEKPAEPVIEEVVDNNRLW